MKDKFFIWMSEYWVLVMSLIIVIPSLLLFYILGLTLDWYNIPEVSEKINILTNKLMVTEWFAITGFIVALAVPTIFFIIGEYRRKKDVKDADRKRNEDKEEARRIRRVDKIEKDKEFKIIYEQNEKQLVCNVIMNYKALYWNNNLMLALYGNDKEQTKKRFKDIK